MEKSTSCGTVMKNQVNNQCFRILVCGLLLVVFGWAASASADKETDIELRALIDQLIESAHARDEASIDEACCLDLLAPLYLQRLALLRLIPDAENPILLDQYRRRLVHHHQYQHQFPVLWRSAVDSQTAPATACFYCSD